MALTALPNHVQFRAIAKFLAEIGFVQNPKDTFQFERGPNASPGLPESITLDYPDIGFDGTFWVNIEVVNDLADRLAGNNDGDQILKAIRKFSS